MSLDLLALGALVVFTVLGAWRGALASALGIASLALGYAVAIVLGPRCGAALVGALGAPSLLALPLGGSVAFAASCGVLGVASRIALAAERTRRGGAPRASADRLLGALFGALRGGVVVLLVGWLGLWLQALQSVRAGAEADRSAGAVSPARVTQLAQGAIESGAQALVGEADASGRMTVHMLARPTETLAGLRSVLDSPRIEALREDGAFWSALEAGDVSQALGRGSFRALSFDAGVRRDLAALGLVEASATDDPKQTERALGDVLLKIAPRLKGLADDPELQALLADPQVRDALARGEHWSLLGHPGFQHLVSRLSSGPTPGS